MSIFDYEDIMDVRLSGEPSPVSRPVLPRLVALGGLKGSGKSTAAQALLDRGYIRVKMAGALKAMLRTLLSHQGCSANYIDRCLEGDLKEEPQLILKGRSPRYAMQTLGTEWGRDLMNENFWADVALNRVQHLLREGYSVVVDDLRFPNELGFLEAISGLCSVYITREGVTPGEHCSENLLGPEDFHSVLDNDNTVEELHAELLATLRGAEGFRSA